MIPKLRAWEKQDERMSYGEVEYFDDSINYRFDHFCTGADEDVEFMQSTGLKDKNGVEIYEGDIVEYSDYEYSFTGIVTQDTVTCWWIKGIDPDDNFNFDDVTDYSEYTCDVKVIGNVHQHHELLEGDKK
ncbi:YopX family protein [Lactococcus lactis]|uniref:YopX family protein n=1 Tax=Lactococcus lactis TaxID=1358 RepID=UPI0014560E20|nr:YopX family protein [Lactococcus lactis]MCT0439725.1 hypothetical protein [Lactococcus lactis subsp. lactis]NLS48098.1 hypothetical protein [Lactococcus lactis]